MIKKFVNNPEMVGFFWETQRYWTKRIEIFIIHEFLFFLIGWLLINYKTNRLNCFLIWFDVSFLYFFIKLIMVGAHKQIQCYKFSYDVDLLQNFTTSNKQEVTISI